MTNLSEVIRRLRNGACFNSNKELGTHRTTIRSLHSLAQAQDWLSPLIPLPDESIIQQRHYQAGKPNPKEKILSAYLDELKRWYMEEKKSFVVIHTLLSERLAEGVTISETTLRLRLVRSNLDSSKTIETFDFGCAPKLSKTVTREFCACDFIVRKENIFFLGASGAGKTHLAQAIGHEAARRGYDVYCERTAVILQQLNAARGDGTNEKK
ncbi:MAG: hypothetical protein A2096_12515 [Spirochaetes bacterium GWF1_41_5]|nr:MAG: hypothetical protein A2096_12515 [Spirochaetes bacterium GWF1_41_5]